MTRKTNRKDRRDGYLVKEHDPMHMMMPYIMGGRADNEAVLCDVFDMTNIVKYMKEKNETAQYKYTYFHVILAALAKTVYLRPLMNRYTIGHRFYDRKDISFSFTAKNKFADDAAESLVIIKADDNDESIAEQIHNKICAEVYKIKTEEIQDDTTNVMAFLTKIPRPLLKIVTKLLFTLDYYDKLPKVILDVDPYRTTAFVSNLGSINMDAEYHHLINWSTSSVFVLINKVKKMPFFNDDGTYEMKDAVKISFTIDERIADGFYFMKSLTVFKHLLENPELLDAPISTPIDL
ncbi:MAG: 2-oxo acid dehydrogenase subunit E2 [Bacillota bacterium]|jgi:pyruvate/2-oxoglutarate dehydrogenase complex dihydrolipoamide acyltransferase (E2) component|nr:2-oxo acid dehydrogenase subunit E2 [Bacillota bacterium]NLL26254.1 2-oxo acid dehydrogenase subunit E2 [Erysipelotrichia bacterium]